MSDHAGIYLRFTCAIQITTRFKRNVPLSAPAGKRVRKQSLSWRVRFASLPSRIYFLNLARHIDPKKGSKKRKASSEPDDPSLPAKKKTKPTTKVTKGRLKGPVDYDRQCGVINDKGLPCSRSLTCKSHAMGAKRSVQGRSRNFDELLLDWQRANKPNFVEPVKRESKAEKKEKREKERLEKKRLAGQAAIALGLDPLSASLKKSGVSSSKKVGKKAAAAAARLATEMGVEVPEDLDELDSEAEVDELVRVVRVAQSNGVLAVPLAVPCDAGSWFVQRRERARCCRDLFLGSLGNGALPANRTNSFFG